MQLILSGVQRRDNALKRFSEHCKGTLVKEWDGKSIPVVVGNLHGADLIQIECRKQKIPYILIDHGYFNRHLDLEWARFCVNNYHCTDWRDSDRKIPNIQNWKNGDEIVILPPAPKISEIYNANNWVSDIIQELKQYTDRSIRVKKKSDGNFADAIKNAYAVVSFGSVGEVEALIAGIPVFGSEYSPTASISQQIFQIENIVYPDRERWLRSIAACQWNKDEMDKCWQRIKEQLKD